MKVFISYSRIDAPIAQEIAKILKNLNIPYFLDEKDIKWGDSVVKTINSAIDKQITHEIVIISPASLKSFWVWYEIGYSTAKDIIILPFLIHPSLDVPSFLSEYNYITNMEDIKKYFVDDTVQYMTIIGEDGKEEVVNIVIAFEFKDTKKEYVVYTKNEIDMFGNVDVYVSCVDRSNKMLRLSGVDSEEEWERIKEVLRKLGETDVGINNPMSKMQNDIVFRDGDGNEIL